MNTARSALTAPEHRTEAVPRPAAVPASAAAALLAAGVGATALGVAILVVEASTAMEEWAALGTAAGALTGKALIGAVAFGVAWLVLRLVLGGRPVPARATVWATSVLVGLGVLLTFPPVYTLAH